MEINRLREEKLKRFIYFLKKNSVYGSYMFELNTNYFIYSPFVEECGKSMKKFFNQVTPSDWLDKCFKWSDTTRGYSFWLNLDYDWRKTF